MGVLNLTPDSFYAPSRGGSDAVSEAATLAAQGADLLDIGGESTRPGAKEVSLQEELSRVLPFLSGFHTDIPISIDTQKAEVARQALAAGAAVLNDVSALRYDPEMAAVAADAGVPVILMHMQGRPGTMQREPHYRDLLSEMKSFFEDRMRYAVLQGIKESKLVLDPGIGFGKTREHNLAVLRAIPTLKELGRPILIGLSRKSFIGALSSADKTPLSPEERYEGTLAANLWAAANGANGLRVHDVQGTARALRTWRRLVGDPPVSPGKRG